MAQKYRIYINENTLLITDKITSNDVDYQVINVGEFKFETFFHQINRAKKDKFILVSDNPKTTLNQIIDSVKPIKAAGGLVYNNANEYLFILRNGKWDLPKGKVELNEEIEIAAIREVEEECGVKVQHREYLITQTYHAYVMFDELIIKKTNWYKMNVNGKPTLIPQTEEGITEARWVQPNDIIEKIKNTYPSIIDVLMKESLIKKID